MTTSLLGLLLLAPLVPAPAPSSLPQEELHLGVEERLEVDLMRRRGENREALEILDEILEEVPGDTLARRLRALSRREACDYEGALEDARQAWSEARLVERLEREDMAACARVLGELLLHLGRTSAAQAVVEEAGAVLWPEGDPRDAWLAGSILLQGGERQEATKRFRLAAETRAPRVWEALLAQARCQRALGRIEAAARTLVSADKVARDAEGVEPDVLVELGDVYFEAYGEVEDRLSIAHSPAELYREARGLHPRHEGALLSLFQLYRFNWRRGGDPPHVYLDEAFAARPRSIPALLARASAAIDDGDLMTARGALKRLNNLAPERRDVRIQRASLAWIEHRRDEARGLLDELTAADPADPAPEREVGQHLLELYRFAEGLPFLERAVARDRTDWRAWRELGRAQANSGDEESARASLAKAVEVAEGRRDAWRDNTLLVLERMAESLVDHEAESLTFAWLPDASAVLETYLDPFYAEAREELSARYGFTPGPVRIEVFRRWEDFSVRSTGFQGYPALGVCFGPVVTAVSPLSELRGQFSWARTSFHEFTHVIHLGLSNNRCPRWVTEGLATWEEGQRSGAWWRNMRRELVDARANDQIIRIRRLNNAFRGPRVLFAYYQGGLLCKMLIEEHGFSPMVRLLEAFDRGADLDAALGEIFARSPEELDRMFLGFVDRQIADLRIEPRWSPENTFRRRFGLSRKPPEERGARLEWSEEWCRVAWGFHWSRQLLDAEEALRLAESVGSLPARGLFLRGEILIGKRDEDRAKAAFREAFERGGEDYRARMALAALLMRDYDLDEAEEHLVAAERAFPGYAEVAFSAELQLAELHDLRGDGDEANEARLRWLAYNAGNYDVREKVAGWLDDAGRHAESAEIWRAANEVDPFRRHLHYAWGRALLALEQPAQALREFDVGLAVPFELDGDLAAAKVLGIQPTDDGGAATDGDDEEPGAPRVTLERLTPEVEARLRLLRWTDEEPMLHGLRARALVELDRIEEARAAIDAALDLDPECEPALEARASLPPG